jgi:two-component system, OmpR family, sensor histidine kinase PhoQ
VIRQSQHERNKSLAVRLYTLKGAELVEGLNQRLCNSLYVRLSLTVNLILLVFLVAIGNVLDSAFVENGMLALRERLLGQMYHLIDAAVVNETGQIQMPLPSHLPDPKLALPDSGLYAVVSLNQHNVLLWRSPSLAAHNLPALPSLQIGEKRWMHFQLPNHTPGYLLGFGLQRTVKSGVYHFNFYLLTTITPLNQQIAHYRQILWTGLLATAILILVLQACLLRWGLQPLRQVRKELGAIESGEINQIIGAYPREVRQLTDKINTLLKHERQRQSRYRNALADLAHSLKTPLAVLLSADETPENLVGIVQEQGTRMRLIVERQLQRAGAANNLENLPSVAIKPIIERLTASLTKIYRNKPIAVIVNLESSLSLRCNETDVIEIFGNLLDNAFKWGQSKVEINGKKAGQQVVIGIHDNGIGIESDVIDRILQRGIRADETTPGNGIGLSVVSEIVEAYQGELKIGTSVLGGAAITISFKSF